MREIAKLYYRARGMRYPHQLASPVETPLSYFPRNSLFHVVGTDDNHPELDPSQAWYAGYGQRIKLSYVTEYPADYHPKGVFRRPPFNLNELTRPFRRTNRKTFQPEKEAWLLDRNENNLVVVNYGYLDVVYHYNPLPTAPYDRWLNRWTTVFTTMGKIAEQTNRNQFVHVPVSRALIGRMILDKWKNEPPGMQFMRALGADGEASYMLMEFWRFLSVTSRDKSLFRYISPQKYNLINLVLVGANGLSTVLNLGYLNSWIKEQPNQTEFSTVTQYSVLQIQNLFLKFFMRLNAIDLENDEDLTGEVADVPTGQRFASAPKVKALPEEVVPDPMPANEDDDTASAELKDLTDSLDHNPADDVENTETVGLSHIVAPSKPAVERAPPPPPKEDSRHLSKAYEDRVADEAAKDVAVLDEISKRKAATAGVKTIHVDPSLPEPFVEVPLEVIEAQVFERKHPREKLIEHLQARAEANLITAAEYRKMEALVERYAGSPDPYGSGKKRVERMVVPPEAVVISKDDAVIPIDASVQDKSMGESTLQAFDKKYFKTAYRENILQAIDAVQAMDVIVTGHEIDVTHTVLGSYENHTLTLKPIDGMASPPLRFTLPVPEKDGTFMVSGSKCIMRKQRVDLPIRKIAPQIVSLSSYYGKVAVEVNQKVSNNTLNWLFSAINKDSLSETPRITGVIPGYVFDNYFKAPMIYNAMASRYIGMKVGNLRLVFDKNARATEVPEGDLAKYEQDGRLWCGWAGKNAAIVVDPENQFHLVSGESISPIGDIFDLLGFDALKAPIDYAEMRVFSKFVPVGVVLSYYIGFTSLVRLLKVDYRIVEGRKNKQLEKHEYAIPFQDKSYIFSRKDRAAALILSGFLEYEKTTKTYLAEEFNSPNVYLNLLMAKGMASVYLRELDSLRQAFVDPITRKILENRNEPTAFPAILLFASKLLTTYDHPLSQDRAWMRERGYERFSGAVYKELVVSIRAFRNKNLSGRGKIAMSPYQVWNAITKDNSLKIVEDINPFQNLKESEVVTYAGVGGRDKDSMNKASRSYHTSNVGMASESSVDSPAVGTIMYSSANPNYADLYGTMKETKDLDPTNLLSTCCLASPFSTTDIPKRMMFITTQSSHTIASGGYKQPHVRTGYESVIGKRTGPMFATAADQDGVVVSVTPKGMVVKYADGEEQGIRLGRLYGVAEGTTYPHDLITPYEAGNKFKAGDILSYNTKFFEPDFVDPKLIVMKISGPILTAFFEGAETHEDSATLSPSARKTFSTEVTKVKSYVVGFDQNVLEVKSAGSAVDSRDVLMIIEDAITANTGNFSSDSLSTLKRLSGVSPKAGLRGTIERIEVLYHGDKDDMTATLKSLADRSDRGLREESVSTKRPVVNGRVTDDYRVSGTPLGLNKAEIRFYITTQGVTGVGDKVAFGHQMKATVSKVHVRDMYTESGEKVDATFSYRSVAARGVLSPPLLGTTTSLLDFISKQAASIYFNG